MRNKLDLLEAKTSAKSLPLSEEELKGMSVDQLMDLSASIDGLKKPYYRIWHYEKKGWDTGFSPLELLELSGLFSLLKTSEQFLQETIQDMHIHNIHSL